MKRTCSPTTSYYKTKLNKVCCDNCNNHINDVFDYIIDNELFEQLNHTVQNSKLYIAYNTIKDSIDNNKFLKKKENCAKLLNNIIERYANMLYWKTKGSYSNSIHMLKDIKDASKYRPSWCDYIKEHKYKPLPHEFAQLFFENGFNDVELLNIYYVVNSADPILFGMILNKGFKLENYPNLLDHLVVRANKYNYIVESYDSETGSGFGSNTEYITLYFDEMFVQICEIMFLEADKKKFKYECSEKVDKNKKLDALIKLNGDLK
jgi:hypothetical protein